MNNLLIDLVFLTALLVAIKSEEVPLSEILKYLQDPEPQLTLKQPKNTTQRISEHGYPAESHEVITEDGYVLTLFRIPYSHKLQNQDKIRPVVLLQHCLFCCSDFFLISGPNDGLPFLLADAGYDVWLGNARGNKYSRQHVSRSVNHPYFWKFSWHEIGKYDLPAMVDYALAHNGQGHTAAHYAGFSQGTTAFFVFLSERPEYNAKIKTAHMLAPVAFMENMRDILVNSLSFVLGHDNVYSNIFNNQEFLPYNTLFTLLGYNACQKKSPFSGYCSVLASMVETSEVTSLNMTAAALALNTAPAGGSSNQVCHYMQEHQSGRFCQYDWGFERNMKLYGQPTPPDYPVSRITAEMHLWYGDNDTYAEVVDVLKLAALLPNRVLHHMADPKWGHIEFLMAREVKKLINDPIIEIMQNFDGNLSK